MEEMVQLEQQFRVGELVWAKFSNYPYWPGYIKKIYDNNTFEVYYFGDDEKSIEPKDKLKKWREYFDEAIKGDIEDENYLFSIGIAMMVQEKDQRVRNHKQFLKNVTQEQRKEIIEEMKEFLLFSKNGNAKNILLRRGKKKPTLTTKDLLKDIKPLKDQIDKSANELKKILGKYKDSFNDSKKLLGRKTQLALSNANLSLKKYSTKYKEIIEPFKSCIFDKYNTEEPSQLIAPLGDYLKKLKKQKLSRNCLSYFEIYNLLKDILINVFGYDPKLSVEEFYVYIRKNQYISVGKKHLHNEKLAIDSKRIFYRNLINKLISSIYFYLPSDFIDRFVGYIETTCWSLNSSKLNEEYINIVEKVINEIMNFNKERNQWNMVKKGKCNGETKTVYTLV